MAADKSISDIDLADFKTPNRRNSGLIKGAEVFHRINDEAELLLQPTAYCCKIGRGGATLDTL